ncbi:hypothetical protein GH866_30110 [Bacillus thuringiensis]|nr:hypothetical protein [Bacillus thuringiensis]
MKYKERKDAKRKYKQALLTTVATMTLGVNTLGNTSSTFAAEEDNISVISTHTINNVGTQTDISEEAKKKTFFSKVSANLTTATGKKIVVAGEKELLNMIKTQKVDFNNASRALVGAIIDNAVPGGMFLSPLINTIWPENGNGEIQQLREELMKVMDEKITTSHMNSLKEEFRALNTIQNKFEKAVNEKNSQNVDASTKRTRSGWASGIEQAYMRLLALTSSNDFKVADLPLYTQIATAHIAFLTSLDTPEMAAKVDITTTGLKEFYNKGELSKLANEYMRHITETYDYAKREYINKIEQVGVAFDPSNEANQQADLNNRLHSAEKKLKDREGVLSTNPAMIWDNDPKYKKNKTEVTYLKDAKDAYPTLLKLYKLTVSDPNMAELSKGTWMEKSGKWHFTNKNGHDMLGWVQDNGKRYYISPENGTKNSAGDTFNKGEMVTGWKEVDGHRYYFSPKKTDTGNNHKPIAEGEMVTDWKEVDGHRYYFSPENGTRGYERPADNEKESPFKEFTKGEMMTGFIQRQSDYNWFFLSPEKNTQNSDGTTFVEGEMMTAWYSNPKDDKHWYYFSTSNQPDDSNSQRLESGQMAKYLNIGGYNFNRYGVCTNPNYKK